mgnify:CR=1 FL=1
MSAEAHAVEHALTAPEYIGHHLRHLQNKVEPQAIVDFSYINYDSLFWSVVMGALGIDTYNLFGVSYGSRVAMGVMQHDPSGLRAVVLDSPWPPEANWTTPLPGLISRETRQVSPK